MLPVMTEIAPPNVILAPLDNFPPPQANHRYHLLLNRYVTITVDKCDWLCVQVFPLGWNKRQFLDN